MVNRSKLQQATLKLMSPLYRCGAYCVAEGDSGYVRFELLPSGGIKYDPKEDNEKLTSLVKKQGFVSGLHVTFGPHHTSASAQARRHLGLTWPQTRSTI